MESKDGFVQETAGNDSELESLDQRLNICNTLVDQLEQKMKDVMQFYSSANMKHPNTPEGGSVVGDEYREKLVESSKKRQLIAAHMEIANAKRMQELMHEFGTILHEIMQHKCAESFMQPVDVIGLCLYDYYEVVEKPMDFRTIKGKMEANDGAGYKNVREICADVRLIFENAMKYYKEGDDLHVMAKTLIDIFETRWLEFLPKVDEEEQRQKEEDTKMQQYIYLSEEVAHAKMAIDLALEMDEVKILLNELKDMLYQQRRKMDEEKKILGDAIALSYEAIDKLNELIAANDPNFQGPGERVEIDLDAQIASAEEFSE